MMYAAVVGDTILGIGDSKEQAANDANRTGIIVTEILSYRPVTKDQAREIRDGATSFRGLTAAFPCAWPR